MWWGGERKGEKVEKDEMGLGGGFGSGGVYMIDKCRLYDKFDFRFMFSRFASG